MSCKAKVTYYDGGDELITIESGHMDYITALEMIIKRNLNIKSIRLVGRESGEIEHELFRDSAGDICYAKHIAKPPNGNDK